MGKIVEDLEICKEERSVLLSVFNGIKHATKKYREENGDKSGQKNTNRAPR